MDFWKWRKNIFIFVLFYLQTASTREPAPVLRFKEGCFDVRMSIKFQKGEVSHQMQLDDVVQPIVAECGTDSRTLTIRLRDTEDTTTDPSTITDPSTDPTDSSSTTTDSSGTTDSEPTDSSGTTDSEPTTDPSTITDSSGTTDSEPTTDSSGTTDSEPTTEPEPTTESDPTTDSPPTTESDPTTDAPPTSESDPTTDSPPTTESDPTTDAPPTTESDPTTDSPPTTESDPTTDSPPTTESDPTTDSPPTTESDPTTGSPPTTESEPTTGSPPTTESDPTTDSPPTTESDPTTGSSPTTESDPTTDSPPTTESDPTTGSPPTTESDPTTGSPPTTESEPTDSSATSDSPPTESEPTTGSLPTTESDPTTGSPPTTESEPTDSSATSDSPPTESEPTTGSPPTTESEPTDSSATSDSPPTESEPTTDSPPSTDSSAAEEPDRDVEEQPNILNHMKLNGARNKQRRSRSLRSSLENESYIKFKIENGGVVSIDVYWASKQVTGTMKDQTLFNTTGKYMCNIKTTVPLEGDGWQMIMNEVEFQANVDGSKPPEGIDYCEGHLGVPEPEVPKYVDINIGECLRATLGFQLMVKYANKNGNESYARVVVPKDAFINDTTCTDVYMKWNSEGSNKGFIFDSTFSSSDRLEYDNSLFFTVTNTSEAFTIDYLQAKLDLTKHPFQDAQESNLEIKVTKNVLNVPTDSSYVCRNGKKFTADDESTVIYMFSEDLATAANTQNVKKCEEDITQEGEEEDSSNKTLAIALGTIAGVAVVAGVGGYIMHRRKKSSGKQGLA